MGCNCASNKYQFDGKTKVISIKDTHKINQLGKSSVAKRKVQNMVIQCARQIAGKFDFNLRYV